MINSLSKDSHMGPHFCPPNLYSGRSAYKPQVIIKTQNNSNHSTSVTIRKPAEPNFCGFFSAIEKANLEKGDIELSPALRLLEEDVSDLGGLIERVESFLSPKDSKPDAKALTKKVCSLLKEAVDSKYGNTKTVSQNTTTFLNTGRNSRDFSVIIEHAKKLVKVKAPKDPTNEQEKEKFIKQQRKAVKELVTDAAKIIQAVKKPKRIFTNDTFHNYLKKAADNQLVFSSLFALFLTCTLRPISIVALPGQKKNKDDKKYAAAHSIASGVIGYVISLIISNPLAVAIKQKLRKNPHKYFSKMVEDAKGKPRKVAEYLGDLDSEKFRSSKDFNKAKSVLNMIPDAILAVPKAVITIALIPIILKYVFGLEKKSAQKNTEAKQTNIQAAPTSQAFKNITGGKNETINK